MIHVGNDVVDLQTTDAIGKAGDNKFIQRVLCPDEQKVVLNSKCPDSILWAFWAAKETAYKAISKNYPDVTSAPRRYPVRLDSVKVSSALSGIVNTPHGAVSVKLFFNEDYVHCIGIDKCFYDLEKIVFGFKEIELDKKPGSCSLSEHESRIVRRFAKERIVSYFGRNSNDILLYGINAPANKVRQRFYIRAKKIRSISV